MSGVGAADTTLNPEDYKGFKLAIVAASWHTQVMDGLIDGAQRAARDAGIEPTLVRVPGTFELPVAATRLADKFDAIVALGVVIRGGTPHEIATEVSLNTAHGVERLVRYAFELASTRRKKVTLVHKTNVLTHAGRLYNRYFTEIADEFPEVETDYLHIDATTIFMVTDPARFDVIVTDNLFGDIITDLAGAVTGGIGYAASGNINAVGEFPSMFEPVHGSAPDIARQNKANPTAAILAGAMLLRHLGHDAAAARIEDAVEADMRENGATVRGTDQVGADVLARLG